MYLCCRLKKVNLIEIFLKVLNGLGMRLVALTAKMKQYKPFCVILNR